LVVTPHGHALIADDAERESGFVGRQSELAFLKKALNEAESGRPRLVLIGGDAGVGKTRLLRQLRSEIEPGALVLYRTRSSSRLPTSPIPWDTGSICGTGGRTRLGQILLLRTRSARL